MSCTLERPLVEHAARLTGLLRVAFTDAGAEWDLAAQEAEHSRFLHEQSAGAGRETRGSGPPLWSELAVCIPQTTPGYAEHAAHYRRFLAAVSSAATSGSGTTSSEALPPEELAAAASAAWRAAHKAAPSTAPHATPDEPSSRQALARLREALRSAGAEASILVDAPDDVLRKVACAHAPLSLWLRQHRQRTARTTAAAQGGAAAAELLVATTRCGAVAKEMGWQPATDFAHMSRPSLPVYHPTLLFNRLAASRAVRAFARGG